MKFNNYLFDEEKVLGKNLYKTFTKTIVDYQCDIELMLDDLGPDKTIEFFSDLIKKCPSFITAYDYLLSACLYLEDAYEFIDTLAFTAYIETKKLLDQEKSKLPLRVDWEYMENRPLLRALNNHALDLWENNLDKEAKDVLEYILTISVNDNIGARYHYLAIDQGITYKRFHIRFIDNEGMSKPNLFKWFDQNMEKNLTIIGWVSRASICNDLKED